MRSKNIKQQENTAAGLSMLEECSWKLEGLHSSAKRTADKQANTGLKQKGILNIITRRHMLVHACPSRVSKASVLPLPSFIFDSNQKVV